MKSSNFILPAAFALIASTNVSATTITITETGSAGVFEEVTDSWSISVWGEGTLEITLVQADYSEWFTWSLSGSGTGADAFFPNPYVGPVNTSLGTWSNGAGIGSFFFTSTNIPSHPNPQDYTIEFAFTPAALDLDPNIDYITVTPSAVPVPAAAWLFGSGLLGLVGVARRKKTA